MCRHEQSKVHSASQAFLTVCPVHYLMMSASLQHESHDIVSVFKPQKQGSFRTFFWTIKPNRTKKTHTRICRHAATYAQDALIKSSAVEQIPHDLFTDPHTLMSALVASKCVFVSPTHTYTLSHSANRFDVLCPWRGLLVILLCCLLLVLMVSAGLDWTRNTFQGNTRLSS